MQPQFTPQQIVEEACKKSMNISALVKDSLLSDITVEGSDILWPVTAQPCICNRHGTLHGGVASDLMQCFSLLHLATYVGFPTNYETATLHVSLQRGVKRGGKCVVRTSIVKHGRQLSFLKAAMVDPEDPNKVYFTSEHTASRTTAPSSKL